MNTLSDLSGEDYCYLTTTGRVTGNPHEIEIWFSVRGSTLYLLSGSGKSDWIKNLKKDPAVTVRVKKRTLHAAARIVTDKEEESAVRTMLADKYNERESDGSLSEWARTALPVALDLKET